MSLADSGSTSFRIVGPEGLNHYLATSRSYGMRDHLEVIATEASFPSNAHCSPETSLVFKDENLSVFAVPIDPYRSVQGDTIPSSPSSHSRKRKASRTPSPMSVSGDGRPSSPSSVLARVVRQTYCGLHHDDAKPEEQLRSKRNYPMDWELHASRLPRSPRAAVAVSYIGLGPSIRGKFDANRAKELGVFGPDRAKLTKGESVLAKDGVTQVTPMMCIGPDIPPSAFMFIECPSLEYIPGIASSPVFDVAGSARLSFIVHRTGPGVLEDVRYLAWMRSFGAKVEHLIASKEYGADLVAYTASSYIQLSLAELDDQIFRVPSNCLEPQNALPDHLPPNTRPLLLDHQIGMHPPAISSVVSPMGMKDEFHPALQRIKEGNMMSILSPDMYQTINRIRTEVIHEEGSRPPQPGDDVIITTLGTGSALPSKTRNVLANLIHIPGGGNILLDVGEGTWGQVVRRFGQHVNDLGLPSSESILRNLKCTFISHIHADHHLGLAKLLSLRRALDPPPSQPLYLIANVQTFDYLDEYHDLEDLGLDDTSYVRKIHSADISTSINIPWRERPKFSSEGLSERIRISRSHLTELKEGLGMSSIQTVDVLHRGPCYGIVFRHSDGWSIAFSGDTMPCDALVGAGRGVTVLIHEATMADEEVDLARAKQHSTVGQAIGVGKQMNARHILLTHFSQRYPKITNLNPSAITDAANVSGRDTSGTVIEPHMPPIVALGFDGAAIPIGSLWKLSKYTPALEQLFAETAAVIGEDDEDSAPVSVPMDQVEGAASTSMAETSKMTSLDGTEAEPLREKKKQKRGTGRS